MTMIISCVLLVLGVAFMVFECVGLVKTVKAFKKNKKPTDDNYKEK